MNIDYTTRLHSVFVVDNIDSFQNVVKKVVWAVDFFDTSNPTLKSTGAVESYLNTDSISSTFTPYENVTQTQILQWASDAEGGKDFFDKLLESGHTAHLEKLIEDSTLTSKDIKLIPES